VLKPNFDGRSSLLFLASTLVLTLGCDRQNGPPSRQTSSSASEEGSVVSKQAPSAQIRDLGPEAFSKLRAERGGTLLDVRTPDEVDQGRIQGASVVDIRDPKFRSKVDKLAKDRPVFVYCRSGGRSAQAAQVLAEVGVKEVYNLDGGISAWKGAGLAVEIPSERPASAGAKSLSTADFDALLSKQPVLLVNYHTEWCSPCVEMLPIVERIEKKHGEEHVLRVNVDESEPLSQREKASGVPVFVLYEAGKETFRHSGVMTFELLDEKLGAALKTNK
jgi:thioredoxin 1